MLAAEYPLRSEANFGCVPEAEIHMSIVDDRLAAGAVIGEMALNGPNGLRADNQISRQRSSKFYCSVL